MEKTLTWIRDNPQLAGVGLGAVIAAFVIALLGWMMARSGASLRPLLWFAGFFALVAGPQAVVHVLDGLALGRHRASLPSSTPSAAQVGTEALQVQGSVPWSQVFGAEADPGLIVDAKRGLGAIVGSAEDAKLSFNSRGESALAARFGSAEEARRALQFYGSFFAFAQAEGSDRAGWTARRHAGQGEWVHVVAVGAELYAWTSTERERVLTRRAEALGGTPAQSPLPAAAARVAAGASADAGVDPARTVSTRLTRNVPFMVGFVTLNLLAAGLWFFKGSAWAARVEPVAVARPEAGESVGRALLGLSRADLPMDVRMIKPGTYEIEWRYADARWIDFMRAHRLKRVQRLVIELDEGSHTARVQEYWSAFDASVGMGGASLRWMANRGIQFFAVDHQRVFGAQLDASGRPTGELSRAIAFNLQDLKAPVIAAVTGAGWRWQPVTWNAPAAVRWLTE